jgi:hypothetical protein
MLKKTTTNSLK